MTVTFVQVRDGIGTAAGAGLIIRLSPDRSTAPEWLICAQPPRLLVPVASRTESAIWVLLIRRRMICPLRWVIPGLAEG